MKMTMKSGGGGIYSSGKQKFNSAQVLIQCPFRTKASDGLVYRGTTVWKKMVEENVCPGRTWQSLKNRFLVTVACKLHTYDVTEDDLEVRIGHKFYKALFLLYLILTGRLQLKVLLPNSLPAMMVYLKLLNEVNFQQKADEASQMLDANVSGRSSV